jgi:acetoin utilization protein AcuB
MKIAHAMTREVLVVVPEMKLSAVEQIMARRRIRHVPVVRGGHLVGILSDRDVLRYEGLDDLEVTAGAAMTPAPVTCGPEASVSRVAQLMLQHKIDSIPVVDAIGALLGLVTSSDLLVLLVDRAEAEQLPFDYQLRVVADGELLDAVA